jgi:hypothetical protein
MWSTRSGFTLNSTGYPDHNRYGDLPLQGKIPMAELGIKLGNSWLVVKSSDRQATRLVVLQILIISIFYTTLAGISLLEEPQYVSTK